MASQEKIVAKKRKIDLIARDERVAWNVLEARIMFLEEAMDSMDAETVAMALKKMREAIEKHAPLYGERRKAWGIGAG